MSSNDSPSRPPGFLGGKLLIASPGIGDPRFDRSVILMCDHSAEHAMGIVLNKQVEGLRLPEVFEQLGVETTDETIDRPVLLGGPVERQRGFVLHTNDFQTVDSTLAVTDHIGLSSTKDALDAMASSTPPRRSMLALGYAGWGSGQLEDELAANAWLVADADETLVFSDDIDGKWENALGTLGVTPEHLSGASGTA
ncbi:YqgE/AlgH family protein [uncultured Maricaulis sp.]|uniref:YqgE/AlgH family protein n=1 Tax=uncultured Maricaulis sp. TaxID=174710 RepID=UPI0030DB3C3D|tara:strand:- start:31631 stop:32218 length:588 start_codon:yes stop_codon:yes gene_type:complete